jgi:hypothetical protein
VTPSQERLGPDDPAGGEVQLRLPAQFELVAWQRLLQVGGEAHRLLRRLVQGRLEQAEGAPPLRFRLVHGEVGVPQQFLRAATVGGEQGNADRGRNGQPAAEQREGLRELFEQALGQGAGGLLGVDAVVHHRELVAA